MAWRRVGVVAGTSNLRFVCNKKFVCFIAVVEVVIEVVVVVAVVVVVVAVDVVDVVVVAVVTNEYTGRSVRRRLRA